MHTIDGSIMFDNVIGKLLKMVLGAAVIPVGSYFFHLDSKVDVIDSVTAHHSQQIKTTFEHESDLGRDLAAQKQQLKQHDKELDILEDLVYGRNGAGRKAQQKQSGG